MPSVKSGTLTEDVEKMVKYSKASRLLRYRNDKGGIVHAKIS